MRRKFFTGIIMLSLFGSCHKSDLQEPVVEKTTTAVTYKDEHIFIVDVKMEQTASSEVTFSFSTLFEKDLAKIQVYGGPTQKNLCSFFEKDVTEESQSLKRYSAVDIIPGNNMNYYFVKYTTNSGDWAYSPIYQIKMK